MRWRDCREGMKVYHTIMTHFGEGTVLRIDRINGLERMFERGCGPVRVTVQWEVHDTQSRMVPSQLRKTPNKKKMRDMIKLYEKRGVRAEIVDDRRLEIHKSAE